MINLKNNLPETFSNIFTLNTQSHKHNTTKNRLILPKVKTISYGSNSITLKAIKQWNEVRNFIKVDIYSPEMTYSKFLSCLIYYDRMKALIFFVIALTLIRPKKFTTVLPVLIFLSF